MQPSNTVTTTTAGGQGVGKKGRKGKGKVVTVEDSSNKLYSNNRLLRSTVGDKEKQVKEQVAKETKAEKEARARGEAQKVSKDAASKLDSRKVPIDAPGQPISATQRHYALRNQVLSVDDPNRYVFLDPSPIQRQPDEPHSPSSRHSSPMNFTLRSPSPQRPPPANPIPGRLSTGLADLSEKTGQVAGDGNDDDDGGHSDDDGGPDNGDEEHHDFYDPRARQDDEGPDESTPDRRRSFQAPETSVHPPIRIQMFDFDEYQRNPLAEHVTSYINTDNLIIDSSGNASCRLSDILPKAAQFNSPLKDPNFKIWRLDGSQQPVSLGRGDTALGSMAGQHSLDIHRLHLQEVVEDWGGVYTGIKLLLEDKSKTAARRRVMEFFAPDPSPLKRKVTAKSLSSGPSPEGTKHAEQKDTQRYNRHPIMKTEAEDSSEDDSEIREIDKRSFKRNTTISDSDQETKVQWLREYFGLPENVHKLPGRLQPKKARDVLDRWTLMNRAKVVWEDEWTKTVPGDVDEIGNEKITIDDLYTAFGFKRSTWFAALRKFEPDNKPLKRARTVLAWMNEPDAIIPGSEPPQPRFAHLNSQRAAMLSQIIQDDSHGKYRHGQLASSVVQEAQSSRYDKRKRERSPRPQRRSHSPTPLHRQRPRSNSYHSEDLDRSSSDEGDRVHKRGRR